MGLDGAQTYVEFVSDLRVGSAMPVQRTGGQVEGGVGPLPGPGSPYLASTAAPVGPGGPAPMPGFAGGDPMPLNGMPAMGPVDLDGRDDGTRFPSLATCSEPWSAVSACWPNGTLVRGGWASCSSTTLSSST